MVLLFISILSTHTIFIHLRVPIVLNPIGARKSLLNVFQDGNCHPKMAMVIDDRLKVWEDKDQPRVHVVPAFTPYYAPQAEVLYFASIILLYNKFILLPMVLLMN